MKAKVDFLVIGSGLAGLVYALKVADFGRVLLVAKSKLQNSNSYMAQGGIAAVIDKDDSFSQHVQDTLQAGAGLCHPEVVSNAVAQAPARLQDLIGWGVRFDVKEKNGDEEIEELDLTREGGHLRRRIVHVQDHTGQAIQDVLIAQVLRHPNIEVLENHVAIDLITTRKLKPLSVERNRCIGAYFLDLAREEVKTVVAQWTVLATGGAGKVYLYTSNWSGATGDGIAMAARAGARVANLEFMQFHPTCLYHPNARNFLISEAVRGEGGRLVNGQGKAFMEGLHPLAHLAPRDIVARSIDAEIKRSGDPSVFIDISHKPANFLRERFPQIHQACASFGIDITTQPIPVVPAAHYLCGGVLADGDGRTDIENLLAVGETACNGFHGANRLASNSLLDCTAFSHNAAELSKADARASNEDWDVPAWEYHQTQNRDELIVVSHMWDEIRQLMWNYVGIVRSYKRLERAQHRLANLEKEIHEYYWNFKPHRDILELRNIALVAKLTVECALRRRNSVGIHFNIDAPEVDLAPRDTVV